LKLLTRETELTRNRAEQEKQSYLRHDCEGLRPPAKEKDRKHGTKACGESLSKTAGESMGRGESLSQTAGESQTARRVPPVQEKKHREKKQPIGKGQKKKRTTVLGRTHPISRRRNIQLP
jgi:hypothetical protein